LFYSKLISLWKPIKLQPKVSTNEVSIDTFATLVDSNGVLAHTTIETSVLYEATAIDDDATVFSTAETVHWPGAPYKSSPASVYVSTIDSIDVHDTTEHRRKGVMVSGNDGDDYEEEEEEEDDDFVRRESYVANDGISTANDSLTLWGDLQFK
jgi:hypothetical protein